MDTRRVGRRIKGYRKLKGYTQAQFAKEIGVPLTVLGAVERGVRKPPESLLDEIAAKLEIEKEEMIMQQGEKED
ncbi:helix-turn-helix transcriptional regulator [Virgibacillus sp. LDC-1]|uniref:helix-turn-helix domain-containing protein n=1 Tax=Virgibacillus sp. LDC-1 TaxID=3039856 RepID=UPI0024DEEB50|nr:helix-turn-helix transcriptional regulator [Virgibacillus sp. LDC-1]